MSLPVPLQSTQSPVTYDHLSFPKFSFLPNLVLFLKFNHVQPYPCWNSWTNSLKFLPDRENSKKNPSCWRPKALQRLLMKCSRRLKTGNPLLRRRVLDWLPWRLVCKLTDKVRILKNLFLLCYILIELWNSVMALQLIGSVNSILIGINYYLGILNSANILLGFFEKKGFSGEDSCCDMLIRREGALSNVRKCIEIKELTLEEDSGELGKVNCHIRMCFLLVWRHWRWN